MSGLRVLGCVLFVVLCLLGVLWCLPFQYGRVVKFVSLTELASPVLCLLFIFFAFYSALFLTIFSILGSKQWCSLLFKGCFACCAVCVFHWVMYMISVSAPYGGVFGVVGFAEGLTFNWFSLMTPLLVFACVVFLVLRVGELVRFSSVRVYQANVGAQRLVFAGFAGLCLAAVPYLAFREGSLVFGVDFTIYVANLRKLLALGLADAVCNVLGGDRPVFYALFYALCRGLSIDPRLAVYYSPLVLIPVLCATIYVLGERLGVRGSFSVLLFLISPIFTLGMYAAFLANFMAFILGNLLLTSFLSKKKLPVLVVLSCLLYFTHPYTWCFYLVGLASLVYVACPGRFIERFLSAFRGVLPVAAVPLALDFARRLVFPQSNVEAVLRVGGRWLDFSNLLVLHDRLFFAFFLHGSLTFLNFLVWSLAVVGACKLKHDSPLFALAVAWSVPMVPLLLFGNGWMQARSLFNYPVYLLAAYGLEVVLENIRDKDSKEWFLLCVIMVGLCYVLRCLLNLLLL